jgi:ATP-dependent Clp protease ATP-binding subunit ClpA
MMFERFTVDARAVVTGAVEHAQRLGHDWIGGEHLLLAVATSDEPMGEVLRSSGITQERIEQILLGSPGVNPLDREALASVGIDVDEVRAAVEQAFGPGALERQPVRGSRRRSSRLRAPFTPQAKDCLTSALREAQTAHSSELTGEHLALALVSARHSAVPGILKAAGVTSAQLRTALVDRYRKAS